MTASTHSDEQIALWNGPAGLAWVDAQELLDDIYRPVESLLADLVPVGSPRAILDVGCGTGATTLAAARRLGSDGRALGVDLSEVMIAAARTRAAHDGVRAQFACADAQIYPFEPSTVDAIISRFGVMFFGDPVRAFGNLRAAARKGAAARLVVWRTAAENPFMTTAERAAAPLLPKLPPRRPDAPGQFALGDRDRISSILDESGWTSIDIQPFDLECTFPEKELIRYLTRLGPVGMALQQADDQTRTRVIGVARTAFEPYVHGADVHFTAACWIIEARAGA